MKFANAKSAAVLTFVANVISNIRLLARLGPIEVLRHSESAFGRGKSSFLAMDGYMYSPARTTRSLLLHNNTSSGGVGSLLLSQSVVPVNPVRNDMEDIIRFQAWIYRTQNPKDCSQAKQHHFRGWRAGFGSHLQVIGNSFLRALLNNHVFILDHHKIDYVDPLRCPGQNYKCLFLPSTRCKATKFDLPIGADRVEDTQFRCTMFDPVTFTEKAGLSQVFPAEWYFREALRYLTRPSIELRQFAEKVKGEVGLNNARDKKGVGLKIRIGEDKEGEIEFISSSKCVNLSREKDVNWVDEIRRQCASIDCDYVFLSADKDTEGLQNDLRRTLSLDVLVMDSRYFVQQELSRQETAAHAVQKNMLKRHEASDNIEIIEFDEAMTLMVMMQIMAETRMVVGSLTSTMTRRIYDFIGMIEESPSSRFKDVDGLSYFTCWREEDPWGLHKKNVAGEFEFDCIPSTKMDKPASNVQNARVPSTEKDVYPEQCTLPGVIPTNMVCGSVGWWYCPESNVVYLPTPKACSTTLRDILKIAFNKGCALMPPGTLHMIPNDAYVFTVVRNPISRVMASYREIDSHLISHRYPETMNASYLRLDRNAQPINRFRAFLDDLFTGRIGSNTAYNVFPAHAHPQYLVSCGAPHVNFTLRQESFDEGWAKMVDDMGPIHNTALKSASTTRRNTADDLKERLKLRQFERVLGFQAGSVMDEVVKAHIELPIFMTDADYELICDLYREDFSCFGYPCEYNSTDLALKAAEKLEAFEKEQLLRGDFKPHFQLMLEGKLSKAEDRLSAALKRNERKLATALKKQEIAESKALKRQEIGERKLATALKKQEIGERKLATALKKQEIAERNLANALKTQGVTERKLKGVLIWPEEDIWPNAPRSQVEKTVTKVNSKGTKSPTSKGSKGPKSKGSKMAKSSKSSTSEQDPRTLQPTSEPSEAPTSMPTEAPTFII